jgi:hypothetical protein
VKGTEGFGFGAAIGVIAHLDIATRNLPMPFSSVEPLVEEVDVLGSLTVG